MRRPREIVLATAILVVSAVFVFLYGGIVPLFPGVVNQPEPNGTAALAAVAFVAAIGVWRQQDWGRWLGIATAAVLLARDLAFVASGQPFELVSVALDLALLFVLVRRWPSPAPRTGGA